MWLLAMLIGSLFPDKRKDRVRLANWLGFADPRMAEHWARLRENFSMHAVANIFTEWTRLDPQRSWKVYAAALDLLIVALLLVWWL
jgi:hypothetical protein